MFKGSIKCVFLNNRPCQARPTLVNINSNETFYYPFTLNVNKCGGGCNTIDDPYARIFAANKVRNMNVKVFNLMPGVKKVNFQFSMNRPSVNVD